MKIRILCTLLGTAALVAICVHAVDAGNGGGTAGVSPLRVETIRVKIRRLGALRGLIARHDHNQMVARAQRAYDSGMRQTMRGFSNPMNIITDSMRNFPNPYARSRSRNVDYGGSNLRGEYSELRRELAQDARGLGSHPVVKEIRAALQRG